MPDSPVVYRDEVLLIMGVLADIRHELEAIHAVLEDDDEAEEDETDA